MPRLPRDTRPLTGHPRRQIREEKSSSDGRQEGKLVGKPLPWDASPCQATRTFVTQQLVLGESDPPSKRARRGDHIKIMLRIYIKVCTCEESFELYASVFPIVYVIETHKNCPRVKKRWDDGALTSYPQPYFEFWKEGGYILRSRLPQPQK